MVHWAEGQKAMGLRSSVALLCDPDRIHWNLSVIQFPFLF